jgi:hypothetical protein
MTAKGVPTESQEIAYPPKQKKITSPTQTIEDDDNREEYP